jgi:hypothetical protein
MKSKLFLVLAFVPALIFGVAPTDELQDAVRAITWFPFAATD